MATFISSFNYKKNNEEIALWVWKKQKSWRKKNITNENLLTFIHIEKPRTLNRAAKQK